VKNKNTGSLTAQKSECYKTTTNENNDVSIFAIIRKFKAKRTRICNN